ncbi:MAG: S8 family serine peptidase, partial [Anaerolineae bacterium]|nr:S8 family serine peptidase [Anaerolineae bacterium]
MKGKPIRRTCLVLAVALIVLGISALPLNNAIFRAQDGKDGAPPRADLDPISGNAGPSAGELTGEVTVYIQLEADPVAVAFAEATGDAQPPMQRAAVSAAAAAGERQAEIVRSEQEQVEAALSDQGVDVLARTEIALNSLMAVVDAEQIPDLTAIDGVLDVLVEAPKLPDNTTSVPHIGAPAAWAAGFTGAGLRIGVIDTGIDYRHRTFGTWDGTPWTGFNQGASGTKVVGGYDFVGDGYTGTNTPIPDNDPLDCNGHGTHVAGTAAGYGVTAAGATYAGPWSFAAPFGTMRVGPGAAPEASLYALKVFGCSGSTALTPLAIEWAVDPNRDGNPADHLDVINLSLGSTNGAATDASAVAANNAALLGVIVVASAGNSGDAYYVTGSPGSAPYVITVANSAEMHQLVTPAGAFSGVLAEFGDPVYAPITGTLQLVNDGAGAVTDACTPPVGFTAGNIAVVDRGTCTFTTKAANVDSVGAIGMITCNNVPGAPYMQSNSTPPVVLTPPFFAMMLSQADCNALKAGMTGGLLAGATAQPAPQDQLSGGSSRGPSRSTGTLGGSGITLKPDIAAPGSIITSARVGTTTGAI